MTIITNSFGTSPDGSKATLYTIETSSGFSMSLTDWGAAIVSVCQPDRRGHAEEIALGFPDASGYAAAQGYLGATCGRFANRIARGKFTLDGRRYELACNNGENHLHGGDTGFNARIWNAEPYAEGDREGVIFTYTSPDGEENYPGELKVRADYALDESGRLFMEFTGNTDKPTVVNLTNHAYWNLAGASSGTILDHEASFKASRYLPVDQALIPTGELKSVEGTPFDFRGGKIIGNDIGKVPGGYDHCMVVDGKAGVLKEAVTVIHAKSGRRLTLHTDRPGVQFYTGNFLKGTPFPKHGGFCLEPEDFPDAPNQPTFPSAVLLPGETYRHRSYIQFSAV
jgi:aldose 1-epimerase